MLGRTTTPIHHVGTFLLFAATALLLVVSISSPVVGDIAILKVTLTNHTNIRNSAVTFGTFGHCILDVPPVDTDQDYCFPKTIGYQPASIMATIDGTDFSTAAGGTANNLTKVMVLHPVACALAFIAFCLSVGAGLVGSLLASVVAAVAWLVTLLVMVTDFVSFGIVKNHVNKDGTGSHAYYSVGMWLVLAAMLCLFFAMFIVLFSCFGARRARRASPAMGGAKHHESAYGTTTRTTTRRKRFYFF